MQFLIKFIFGKIIEIICFPVHNVFGFTIEGKGIIPFQFSICIKIVFNLYLFKKVSLRVNSKLPSKES